MIRLTFVTGGAIRKVIVDGRLIKMSSQETGHVPIIMDLDKLDNNNKYFEKMNEEEKKTIKELKKLNSEVEMADDIVKDFQSTGWRCVFRE